MSEPVFNDTPDQGGIPANPTPVPATLGDRLKAERESRNLSVEQVAGQLNLAVRQIVALEANRFEALPGMASVRGFVRAYAKLLKVDPESLIALIPADKVSQGQQLEPRLMSSASLPSNRLPSGGRSRAPSPLVIGAIVLMVALLGLFGAQRMGWIPPLPELNLKSSGLSPEAHVDANVAKNDGDSNSSAASKPSSVDDAASKSDGVKSEVLPTTEQSPSASDSTRSNTAAATVATNPDSTRSAPANPDTAKSGSDLSPPSGAANPNKPNPQVTQATNPASTATPSSATVSNTVSAPTPAPVSSPVLNAKPASGVTPVVAAPTVSTANSNSVAPTPAGTKAVLHISAKGDSWVEVRGSHGIAFSRLMRNGSEEDIPITEPSSVTIGNAGGIEAKYKGEVLDLKNGSKNNVVRLSLK